jgi:DNA polymerase I-like protein with 3'-5' exonuclease and polymerase domains
LFYKLRERLVAAGRWTLYETAYAPLLPVLANMLLEGINTDREARRFANARLVADCIDLQDRLAELAGEKLHAKKSLSGKKVKKFLYETLGLPVMRKRGAKGKTGAITSDEVTLRKLQLRYPQQCGHVVPLMLEHNRKMKLASFATDTKTDDDGRLRCVYEPVTEAARLSSSENAFKTGTNIQNQDRDPIVRSSFIPDRPDHVFLEVDCSQAESRIVYTLSGDDELYRMAQLSPNDFDQHSYNAHCVFRAHPNKDDVYKYRVTSPSDLATTLGYVSYDQRYLGKRTQHGFQRGMGADKLADLLLKDDVIETPEQCANYLKRIGDAQAGTQRYFEWIRAQVMRDGFLENSWGFRWSVQFEKKESDLYRRAYSFLPQSEVAFLLNVWGLISVAQFASAWYGTDEARVVAQVHDSVLISVLAHPDIIVSLCNVLHENLTQPRTYATRVGPRELSMPVEFKIGPNWAFPKDESTEWKRVPTRDEIARALEGKIPKAA